MKKLLIGLLSFLVLITPAFAQTPIDQFILNLKATGFPLVLLWLLTLAVVYGVLSQISGGVPKSVPARGVISIVVSFMVLFAAAAGPAVTFITNLVLASILIAFGLMIAVIFLELSGAKVGGEHIFAKHPVFFGGVILIILVLVFIGAGAAGVIPIPYISVGEPVIAIGLFLLIMVLAIWVLMKETGKKE